MCVCVYVCMYEGRISLHVCMHVCMRACMHACAFVCMPAYMCVCMHACVYVCMYACDSSVPHHIIQQVSQSMWFQQVSQSISFELVQAVSAVSLFSLLAWRHTCFKHLFRGDESQIRQRWFTDESQMLSRKRDCSRFLRGDQSLKHLSGYHCRIWGLRKNLVTRTSRFLEGSKRKAKNFEGANAAPQRRDRISDCNFWKHLWLIFD